MRVYFDNAATTPLAPEVIEAMLPYMQTTYGNPSSIHSHGREARSAIEIARKRIAELINAAPSEIFFTSGGTEADNFALRCTLESFSIKRAITSQLEHHAVLHTLEHLSANHQIQLEYVDFDEKGNLDLEHLDSLLKDQERTLVSLMNANNEVGNLNNIQTIGEICRAHQAVFHSDTVQTVGHFSLDMQAIPVDFIVGAAHKFHGPKGIGFLYINSDNKIHPLIHGGAQERNMRGGTENIYGIVGMAKALELACDSLAEDRKKVEAIKSRMIAQLQSQIPGIAFNGESANLEKSLYTVLNVCFPHSPAGDMLVFNLDIAQISASAGSACSSGSDIGSHVLAALNVDPKRTPVRFSFSKYNLPEEVDYVVTKVAEMYQEERVS